MVPHVRNMILDDSAMLRGTVRSTNCLYTSKQARATIIHDMNDFIRLMLTEEKDSFREESEQVKLETSLADTLPIVHVS